MFASFRSTTLLEGETSASRKNDDENNEKNNANEDSSDLEVAPEHSVLEMGCLALESAGISVEAVSFLNQDIDAVTTLKDLLDVVHHDSTCAVHVRLDLCELVCIRVCREVVHLALQNMRELTVHGHGSSTLASVAVARVETLLEVLKEGEAHHTAEVCVGHAQVGDLVRNQVVERILLVVIGTFAVLNRNLLENPPGDLDEVARRPTVLCKHSGPVGHKRIDDRHFKTTKQNNKKIV